MKHSLLTSILLILTIVVTISAGDAVIAFSSEQELTGDALKKIFLGKKKSWDDGTKIVIAVLKGGEIHEAFMSERLKKKPSQFTIYWKQLVFTGRGVMPKSFENEKGLIEFVSSTKGAIGYISEEKATQLPNGVVTITIK